MAEPFFEVFEHPSDIGFRAFADNREALFVHAALAMLSIAGDPLSAQPVQGFPLAVRSGDMESLMVDWLTEVLHWYDGKQVAFRDFRITELHDNSIEAIGIGEPRDPARHSARLIVKEVAYHRLKVERRNGVWIAEVYLEI
jgi:SHS2 domain-containing protein